MNGVGDKRAGRFQPVSSAVELVLLVEELKDQTIDGLSGTHRGDDNELTTG